MQLAQKITFLLFLSTTYVLGQINLEAQEIALNKILIEFRQAISAEQMDAQNEIFKNKFRDFLSLPGVFDYKFKHLESVAILESPDEKIRIVNWNIEYPDMSYAYGGFILIKSSKIHTHNMAIERY